MSCDYCWPGNCCGGPNCKDAVSAEPLTPEDLIEGQKVAEAMAERFPQEINSHKGRLFELLKISVAASVRDSRLRVIEAVAKMVHVEAEACICDIVPEDDIGRREANARASALLTAVDDIRAMSRTDHRKPQTP